MPAGCDLYTLYTIIHDWDDSACLRLLGNIRQALPAGGMVLVIESPVPAGSGASTTKGFDLEMLLTSGGRERTEGEYRLLFRRAGLRAAADDTPGLPVCHLRTT
ncbi:MAG: methyltransferase [Dehalococcoidia bacterium]